MKKIVLSLVTLAFCALLGAQPVITQKDRDRAAGLVAQMTLQEKCLLITGQSDGFHTAAIERLGIQSVRLADGPQGVRNKTFSTYYPCGLAIAASWSREVAKNVGAGIGVDAGERGVGIMLCPGVNIYRYPLCGRNFEYMGEDPYLASETALNYIQGMQETGVIATIKHFAANNQEYERHKVNSIVDERTLNEIYFPTFRKAVEKGHVGAVMTSYNPLNSVHAAESPWLIKENLRKWGHEGIVMSDWTSTYTTAGCLTSGLDLEMPWALELKYDEIKHYVENGLVDISEIDEKCIHILQTFSAYGFLDRHLNDVGDWTPVPVNENSRAAALRASVESAVLLKNDNVLPVEKGNIVVLGPNADYIAFGGGSGSMQPIAGTTSTLYQGLSSLGKKYKVTLMKDASDAAALSKADAVIVAVGFNKTTETEGADRKYVLPDRQDDLILQAAAANSNVVVVLYSGGEVDVTKWIGKVKGFIMAWYAGQEGGKALASIISGAESPSGKLPFTFWGDLKKNPVTPYYNPTPIPSHYKTMRDGNAYCNTEYKEGLFFGYRAGGEPMFPFGYGLTYSTFSYSNLAVVPAGDGYDVTFTLTNTGNRDAAEVAQVYVAPVNPSVLRPAHELKGYSKTMILKGQSAKVSIHLGAEAFKHYDVRTHSWLADKGEYKIQVGSSSETILLETSVRL